MQWHKFALSSLLSIQNWCSCIVNAQFLYDPVVLVEPKLQTDRYFLSRFWLVVFAACQRSRQTG